MAGDSSEPTRQHRSSRADDAEELSKRRKHRDHQHRRRHHRHRSKQDEKETRTKSQEELDGKKVEEVEVEERNLENYGDTGGGAAGEVMVPSSLRIAGVDYDMEEGEILEDDGLVDYRTCDFEKVKKNLESDVESGEIDTDGCDNSNMGGIEEYAEGVGKNLRNLGKDSGDGKESGEMDWEKASTSEGLAEGDYARKYHKDDDGFLDGEGKRKRDSDAEVERRSERNSLSSEKRHRAVAHPCSHDKYLKEDSHSNLLKSPEWSRARSRSRSILHETTIMGTPRMMDDPYHKGRKQRSELDDERMIAHDRNYGNSSRYDVREKEKEHNSSRYTERMERNWDNGSRHRRKSDDLFRERSRRSDFRNVSSKNNPDEMDNREVLKREEDRQEDYQERIVMQLEEQEEDDLERIKEESRRRKQAILEKYKNQRTEQQNETREVMVILASGVPVEHQAGQPSEQVEPAEVIAENIDIRVEAIDIDDADSSFSVGKSPLQSGLSVLERPTGTGGLGEGTPKSERSVDMFCDDIFGASPAGVRKMLSLMKIYLPIKSFSVNEILPQGKGDGVAIETSGLHDNWDDAEGYYGYRLGEVLDGRYEIVAAQGKGVFSIVVRAKDLKAKSGDPEEVAIKIIRSNETMYKAGMEELVILKKLSGADPENKRHCVCFLSTFKYRNHLCLVFESLHMNLREVLKKFGRNIGLKLTAVRAYAKQLFIALKHLKNCGILHCDIKPDNMLVNEAKNILKLCDFGNAMFAGKNEITPYLVSRFYRAPEISLPYDHPMDMWSIGCCLFELYTGKVLFPGSTNNDMLRFHMELKGPFPKKMLRKGGFVDHHFDHDLNFLATEEDPVTKKAIRRLLVNIKPKDFGSLILGSPGEDPKMVANFKDLMEKIFVLDPDKRLNILVHFDVTSITQFSNDWAFICLCILCSGARTQETVGWAWLKFLEMILGRHLTGSSFHGLFSVSIELYVCFEETIQWFR
ncbi:hypothetical protein DH2020_032424 [Rehmannia glutinosa]|uniref:non-specific serine/threonine protein kinase n=1 Tax=Rehmannia glutinosa TaxID=99300 RepID=A0ABR0VHM6_REHGL